MPVSTPDFFEKYSHIATDLDLDEVSERLCATAFAMLTPELLSVLWLMYFFWVMYCDDDPAESEEFLDLMLSIEVRGPSLLSQ